MRAVIAAGIGLVVLLILNFICIPTLAWGFDGWTWIILLAFLVAGLIHQVGDDTDFSPFWIVAIGWFLVVNIGAPVVSSGSMFYADDYRKLLGKVDTMEVNSVMSPISPENVAIIDNQTAHRLADKILGTSDKMLGSQVEIGPLELQQVRHKLYYVAPLLHTSIFKWWSNGDQGTNGYVMVSATDERDVQLIQEVGGKPVRIVYQPNAWMGQDLERHTYFNGHKSVGMTEFSFEIDDEGKPYYVISLYDKKVGFSGPDVTGVCLVDVETGEIKDYTVQDAPEWVDRIIPHSFVDTQIDDWGEYVHGWYNPSDKDRVTTTEGMSLVYGDDKRCYFYTGVQSVGKNNSSIGFMMVDSRTKHVKYYKQAGATEEAAMRSAEGKVSEKQYKASYPRPYNIDGKWTYVMSLKDNEGLIKSVAMVSVQEYNIVGVGPDVRSAMRAYKSEWNSTGNAVAFVPQAAEYAFDGIVDRWSTDIRGGNTYYYFTLQGHPEKAFVATSSVSEEAALTRVGDKLHVAFDENDRAFVDVQYFDNLNLNPIQAKSQENLERDRQATRLREDSASKARDQHSVKRNLKDSATFVIAPEHIAL